MIGNSAKIVKLDCQHSTMGSSINHVVKFLGILTPLVVTLALLCYKMVIWLTPLPSQLSTCFMYESYADEGCVQNTACKLAIKAMQRVHMVCRRSCYLCRNGGQSD